MCKQKQKRFFSIRLKLFSRVALIFSCAILLFVGLTQWWLPILYTHNTKRTMRAVGDAVDVLAPDAAWAEKLSTLEKENGVSLDIYERGGKQIYFGKNAFSAAIGKVTVSDHEDFEDGSCFEKRCFERENAAFLVYARTLSNGNTMELYCKTNVIDQSTQTALFFMACTGGLALLFALIFIYVYSGRFTKPLIEMRDVTKGIADMDFSRKCTDGAHDEIGELSGSINRLSDSLKGTLEDLNQKNEQLLQDIEKEHALEKMRKDFIASVSHELKTPISIIGGYAEGAKLLTQSGQTEKAVQYCQVIGDEAERMNALVLELLELSKYESGAVQIAKERFDLNGMITEYLESLRLPVAEKGIRLESELPEEALCFADRSKIHMVLNNYVQNACSHADGERYVLVKVSDQSETHYRLSVFNTGKTIPPEDLEKVWKSFYRADKAHSRKEGRFGLGLSIVEEIQKLHGTDYGVQNEADGVLFWADVEKAK